MKSNNKDVILGISILGAIIGVACAVRYRENISELGDKTIKLLKR